MDNEKHVHFAENLIEIKPFYKDDTILLHNHRSSNVRFDPDLCTQAIMFILSLTQICRCCDSNT